MEKANIIKLPPAPLPDRVKPRFVTPARAYVASTGLIGLIGIHRMSWAIAVVLLCGSPGPPKHVASTGTCNGRTKPTLKAQDEW